MTEFLSSMYFVNEGAVPVVVAFLAVSTVIFFRSIV